MYNNQLEKNLFSTSARRNLAEKKNKHLFSIEGKFAMLRLWAMNQCSEARDAFYFYDSAFTSEFFDGFLTDSLDIMYIGCDDGVHERVTGSLVLKEYSYCNHYHSQLQISRETGQPI